MQAGLIAGGAFGAYAYGCARYGVSARARSICFTSLVVSQLLHALSSRSARHVFLSSDLPPNRMLSAVVAGSLALQGAIMAFSPLRRLAGVAPIGVLDGLVALLAASGAFALNEWAKVLAASRERKEEEENRPGAA